MAASPGAQHASVVAQQAAAAAQQGATAARVAGLAEQQLASVETGEVNIATGPATAIADSAWSADAGQVSAVSTVQHVTARVSGQQSLR
jgi:hypothetical protein